MENRSDYKIAPLVFWCVAGVLLMVTWSLCSYWRPEVQELSWHCPFIDSTVGAFWQSIDEAVFFNLNGSLGTEKNSWNLIWAIANYRAFDLLAAVFMLVILLMYGRDGTDKDELIRRVGTIFGCIAYVVISSQLLKLFIRDLDRNSATIIHEKISVLLGDLYPAIDPKVKSKTSFPGDHAIILIGYTVAMFRYGKAKYGVPALVVTLVFALPRLVGGAHWLTDIVVGAGFMIMVGMSIFFYTPLYLVSEKWSAVVMSKLPLVGFFADKIVRK